MKKELPSGIGTIFSLGPEKSGFNGATPTIKKKAVDCFKMSQSADVWRFPAKLTLQTLDGSQLLVFLPVILFVLKQKQTVISFIWL